MDNFVVSARKYRPSVFDGVVGQKAITLTLQNAIRTNTLAQAFLFCGPRGVGKTTCARIMAKTINCLKPTSNIEACNECESCISFNNSNSFNIYELDAASNNSVEDIRNLVEQVRIPPQIGKYKVYIIDEVHMLSQAAFNAFLKTLEEPPTYAKFILATTEKHKIIPTILSRCQIFDFKRITVDDITKHLQNIASKEDVEVEEEALNIIAQKADGALRDALSIFDQMVSFSGNKITYKDVIINLNVLDYEYYFRMIENILSCDINSILLLLNDVIENGFDPQHFIQGLASHLRNLLLGKDEKVIDLMEVSRQLKLKYAEQAVKCSQYFLLKALNLANQCDLDFRNSNNKRLHLEICLLKMCYINTDQTQQTPIQQHKVTQNKPIHTSYNLQTQKIEQVQQSQQNQQNQQTPVIREVKDRLKKTGTISIKENNSQKNDNIVEKTWNDEFTQEQLTEAWNDFVKSYQNVYPSFVAGISKAQPALKNNFEIHFKIDNILVIKDQHRMHDLYEYLKNTLHNNQFKLIEEVVERHVENIPYTDRNKFKKMAEQNPNIVYLKDSLDLEIDI